MNNRFVQHYNRVFRRSGVAEPGIIFAPAWIMRTATPQARVLAVAKWDRLRTFAHSDKECEITGPRYAKRNDFKKFLKMLFFFSPVRYRRNCSPTENGGSSPSVITWGNSGEIAARNRVNEARFLSEERKEKCDGACEGRCGREYSC